MEMGSYNDHDGSGLAKGPTRESETFDSGSIYVPDVAEGHRYETDDPDVALRDSWQTQSGARFSALDTTRTDVQRTKGAGMNSQAYIGAEPPSPGSPLPAVVVTPSESHYNPASHPVGRAPIVRNVGTVSNYSRPVRVPSLAESDSESRYSGDLDRDSVYNNDEQPRIYNVNTNNYHQYSHDERGMDPRSRTRHNSSSVPVLETADILDPESKRRVLERNMPSSSSSSSFPRGTSPLPTSSSTLRAASPSRFGEASASPLTSRTPSPSYPYSANTPSSRSRSPLPTPPSSQPSSTSLVPAGIYPESKSESRLVSYT
ncbi:hypothetical protein BDP27DRAFT_1359844 [Rhodocollybia butyracea]|uniref:Uncharacterized protein n=1 Tax=Rhodocollybia butyracea TaxID=206335 RepID=A0A9P5Q5I9_9AGAR|nr:hypothetical protein BDP27DRAFT_1359844 [Rhodocollybia butyracea]